MTDFYQRCSSEYFDETFYLDSSTYLAPFIRRLEKGCRVLDVGCGSGRDLFLLKSKGFEAIGLERSKGLAQLARDATKCNVLESDLWKFDFSTLSADALLISGVLVHIPHNRFDAALKRVLPALMPHQTNRKSKARKFIFLSVKQGQGKVIDGKGRVFYLWQDRELQPYFKRLNLKVHECHCTPSVDGKGTLWLGYILSVTETV